LYRILRPSAAVVLVAALASCTAGPSGGDGTGSAANDASTEAPTVPGSGSGELEGVENFYGQYGDYPTVKAAIQDGEITEEQLDYPFVVRQAHVDSENPTAVPVYDMAPPVGGDHLSQWQTCTGIAYQDPIADGNAVHSMEHGAVWLTYDPALVDGDGVDRLASLVEGRDYSLMSPYPDQGVSVSLQSWGNRYQTGDLDDPMIEAYLDTYILNVRFNPEPNATCSGGVSSTVPL
jgi:hypothetical protein